MKDQTVSHDPASPAPRPNMSAERTAPQPDTTEPKTPRPSANLQRCKDAADIAFQLIEHLAKNGHAVEEEYYGAVYKVSQIEDGDITPATEHEFWSAYAEIVKSLGNAAEPEGIYFTALYEMQKSRQLSPAADSHRRELSNRSRFLIWFSVLLLGALVGLLAYGNVLNNMLRSIDLLNVEYQLIDTGQFEGTRISRVVTVGCMNSPAETAACNSALVEIEREIISAVALIDYWIFWEQTAETPKAKTYARQTFIFLENYIYPLLAGALGACVSLMRLISHLASMRRLHLRLFQSIELRIAMGTIAGIFVGWVSAPELKTGISLTPLALAFAAGYGVDIIYNLFDRVVEAFSPKRPGETIRPDER